jgi:hypothetical protein
MPVPVKCRSCQAEIIWVKTKSGKVMPCDPLLESFITADGRVMFGYKSHFSTCPDANSWRSKNKPIPGSGKPEEGGEAKS